MRSASIAISKRCAGGVTRQPLSLVVHLHAQARRAPRSHARGGQAPPRAGVAAARGRSAHRRRAAAGALRDSVTCTGPGGAAGDGLQQ